MWKTPKKTYVVECNFKKIFKNVKNNYFLGNQSDCYVFLPTTGCLHEILMLQ